MSKKKTKSKIQLSTVLKVFGIVLLIGIGITIGVLASISRTLPAWDTQQLSGAKTTLIYDDKGQAVSKLHAEENRTEVTIDKIPQDLINAFIATEDRDFYNHRGVNYKGIIRALVRNVQSGDLTGQGASTITQQLARNAFLGFEKKWDRKLKEVILAYKLESKYSKEEILTMYMNKIYFGAGAYGVQAAANTYFSKDVSELTLEECALIAGLVQSPSSYDPFQFYDRAKARQEIVLDSMQASNFIDYETAEKAKATELKLKKSVGSGDKYGFFVDAVIEEAISILTELGYEDPNNTIYRSGLKIYTTMDSGLQAHADELFKNQNNFPNQSVAGETIQAALVLLDHSNGEVKAIMGGRAYEQRRGFNRATNAYRQPGSAIKPLAVYAPALELNYMPYYVLDDSPISYKIGNDIWSPENYDKKYRGLITMRTAVQWSVNTYAIQLLDQIGIRNSFDFLSSMGFELIDKPGHNDLGLSPLALGSLTKGATPLQMAAGYGAIANKGVYAEPYFISKIIDDRGIEIYKRTPQYKRIMAEETAWLMSNMLQTVVTSGTGTNFNIPGVFTAGKTGTTEKYMDSWFAGFSSQYAGAVWMGYDKQHTMSYVYGGGYPAMLLRSMVQKGHAVNNPAPPQKPSDIITVTICKKSGKLPSDSCPDDQLITEFSHKNFVPTENCDLHQMVYVCPDTKKLAGKYCPNPQVWSMVKVGEDSVSPDRVPTEFCDIHNDVTIPGMFSKTVYICRDPSHGGQLYRANIPNATQKGGCPNHNLEEVILQPGEQIPYCNHPEHQIERKKPNEVLNSIIDR